MSQNRISVIKKPPCISAYHSLLYYQGPTSLNTLTKETPKYSNSAPLTLQETAGQSTNSLRFFSPLSSPTGMQEYADSMSPTLRESSNKPKNKEVTFHSTVKVILIPARNEFFNAGLAEEMWISKEEHQSCKASYREKIMALCIKNPNLDFKELIKKLIDNEQNDEEAVDQKENASLLNHQFVGL